MIIGICGGTGSGKTTIARKIVEKIGEENIILVEQDSYYLDLADLPLDERRRANFDHPDAIDFDSIAEHLGTLKRGESVEMPIYDFKTHTRNNSTFHLEPKPIVIIEGILLFSDSRILELLDAKIFVDAPADIRLLRRIKRDIDERGRTLEQVLNQYERTIRPMHQKFVKPFKKYADVIIPQDTQGDAAIDFLCGLIREKIREEAKAASN